MHELAQIIRTVVEFLNTIIWSFPVLFAIFGIGVYFSFNLKFFQFTKIKLMFKNIIGDHESDSGISVFSSLCTAMATRVGLGNIVGVAIAIYKGGPGTIFWMWVLCLVNAAMSFVECTLSQLYKEKVDGEYRGSSAICALRGLGMKKYGVLLSLVLGLTIAFLAPAADSFSLTDAFSNATGAPRWMFAFPMACIFLAVVMGGIKRIGRFSSVFASAKVLLFLGSALIVILFHIDQIPAVFTMIFRGAFGLDQAIWGSIAYTIAFGFRRGQYAMNTGMGEAMPAAAAAQSKHPIVQGFSNAAGVFICGFGMCTFSAIMILSTQCFFTESGYVGAGAAAISTLEPGVANIQAAYGTVFGQDFANWFVVVFIALFTINSLVGYYYESETSLLYLLQGEENERKRKMMKGVLRCVMFVLIFIYGNLRGDLAWDISDFSIGSATILNVIMLVMLSKKVFVLFNDYMKQHRAGKTPVFEAYKYEWKGVDTEIWSGERAG